MLNRLFSRDPLRDHIAQLESEMLSWIGDVWRDVAHDLIFRIPDRFDVITRPNDPLYPYVSQSIARLRSLRPDAELSVMAADMLFNPTVWHPRYGDRNYAQREMLYTLVSCAITIPPPNICRRLRARIEQFLIHPKDHAEITKGMKVTFPSWRVFWPPELEDCLDILKTLPVTSDSLDLMEDIVLGRLDSPVTENPENWQGNRGLTSYSPSSISVYTYVFGDELAREYSWMMTRLFDHGRLDVNAFCTAAQHNPRVLGYARQPLQETGRPDFFQRDTGPALSAVLPDYCDHVSWLAAQNLSEDNCKQIKELAWLRGGRFLVQAARCHSERKMGKLVYGEDIRWREDLEAAVIHMANVFVREPESAQERLDLVAQLSAFPRDTMRYLLPVAPNGHDLLCEALGWQAAIPLAAALSREQVDEEHLPDVLAVRQALEQAGDKIAKDMIGLFRGAHVHSARLPFFEAIAGWNRTRVEQGLPKRNQMSVRALGLLPLQRGDAEVLERYTFLMRFAKESKQFGAQRQASEQAAAEAGLSHLAQTAGYADPTRLEWAMEARLGGQNAAPGRIWSIGDYEVSLTLPALDPELIFRRGDRTLTSAPEAVRQNEAYAEIKEAVAVVRNQISRVRTTFEEIMATEQSLSGEDLSSIAAIPAANALLRRLILRSERGELGLLDPVGSALITLDGATVPLGEGVSIAHSYHLFESGQLAGWQRAVVHQRIIQPFKQAFRELYVVTPAEEETVSFSNRFAGHVLDPRIANRLFQARRWSMFQLDNTVPYKVFAQAGIVAEFLFPDAGHFLAETDVITSDQVYFAPWSGGAPDLPWSLPGSRPAYHERWGELDEGRIPLNRIPPLIFSEVMRDADLIVSVARTADEALTSQETFVRRGELVAALVEDLGLPGVTVEGHFAHVQGRRARYRVHLGSAAIHIEPGHYLCVVPDRKAQTGEKLFLPFADAHDSKVSEVISKILLLANDQAIKDPTILRQIEAHRATP